MSGGNGRDDVPPEVVVRHYMTFCGHMLAAMVQTMEGPPEGTDARDVLAALALDLTAGEATLYEASVATLEMMSTQERRRESGGGG